MCNLCTSPITTSEHNRIPVANSCCVVYWLTPSYLSASMEHISYGTAPTQDFKREAEIARDLFSHFTRTWRDRQVYWLAKERARVQQDLLVVIVDSYDHAKMSLPKFPKGRTPKRSLYENTRSTLVENWSFFDSSVMFSSVSSAFCGVSLHTCMSNPA